MWNWTNLLICCRFLFQVSLQLVEHGFLVSRSCFCRTWHLERSTKWIKSFSVLHDELLLAKIMAVNLIGFIFSQPMLIVKCPSHEISFMYTAFDPSHSQKELFSWNQMRKINENIKRMCDELFLQNLPKVNIIGFSSSTFHKLPAMRCSRAISEATGDETWKV